MDWTLDPKFTYWLTQHLLSAVLACCFNLYSVMYISSIRTHNLVTCTSWPLRKPFYLVKHNFVPVLLKSPTKHANKASLSASPPTNCVLSALINFETVHCVHPSLVPRPQPLRRPTSASWCRPSTPACTWEHLVRIHAIIAHDTQTLHVSCHSLEYHQSN